MKEGPESDLMATRRQRARPPVLVVDDDQSMRESLVDLLFVVGIEAAGVRSAEEALARLDAQPLPPVVILDWSLPGMSGGMLMERMKAHPAWRLVPVVVITGASEVQAPGAEAVFRKPVETDEILAAVTRALEAPARPPDVCSPPR